MTPKHSAPYSTNGSLQYRPHVEHQPDGDGGYTSVPPEWRQIKPFKARLRIDDWVLAKPTPYLTLKDRYGARYPILLGDLLEVIKTQEIDDGYVNAWWVAHKRGNNYGIRLLRDEDHSRLGD